MNRWLINLGALLLILLAGSTAYYASKATVLEQNLRRRAVTSPTVSSEPTTSSSETTSAVSSSPSSSTPAVSSTSVTPTPTSSVAVVVNADRLAQPNQTYTVLDKDTLYPIGLKFNISWQRIAEANNLVEPYKLKLNQVLIIPEVIDANLHTLAVKFTTDPARVTAFQQTVDGGKDAWRLDPVGVATNEASGVYGLSSSDDFHLTNRDDQKGSADVIVTHLVNGKTQTYDIILFQPGTKGPKGVWTLVSIQSKTTS